MRKIITAKIPAALFALALLITAAHSARAAATIVIQNNDSPNVGFNDPTPVAPVGNNTGTTLGQQRLNAFQFAANIWGATLNSAVTITIQANWAPLTCSSSSGTLAQSGANDIFADFPNAPFPGTWYSVALANALSGTDQNGSRAEIRATFNSRVGTAGCLDSGGQSNFYLGLDNNHANDMDLVAVLMHEFTHGFGFATFTNAQTGVQDSGMPSIYDRFLLDNSTHKTWIQMTASERQASALNNGNLVWSGPLTTSETHTVLGTPRLKVNSPGAIAGNYAVGTADFGAHLSAAGITAIVVQASPNDGCSALGNAAAVSGKLALIDRGTCTFVQKVKNAQSAGAVGVIIVNNVASPATINMGGGDASISIPSVMVSLSDGNTIKTQLGANVNSTEMLDVLVPQGADAQTHPLMYAPTTYSSGSSVSHWDTVEFPNQLMEPGISGDLTHSVAVPWDLTLDQLRDVGWSANPIGDAAFFTRQQYVDFFNREPDPSGFAFWTKQIYSCGIDKACVRLRTINVSAAFFVSTEFQRTGYLVERLYRSAYGEATQSSNIGSVQVPMVRFNEFQADMAQLEQGVIVGQGNWQQALETNTQALLLAFVQRPQFTAAFPTNMTPTAFVDQLNARAGGVLSATERNTAIGLFSGATDTTNVTARWQALRQVAEDPDLINAEFNKAFVLMQYFGYLRRNPNDAPDTGLDYSGYEFWLKKLNSRSGDYVSAQMVQGFIDSGEYRSRFGQ
jgi:hypothetical protein